MLRFVCRDDRPFPAAAQSALHPVEGLLAALLYRRGVETSAQADAFLHPSLASLHSPALLGGMAAALALLAQARAEGWPTVVYGDYDVDGVCAAALLTEALRAYGLPAAPHVPLRAEGYGLNLPAVEKLAGEYRLLITVDLGMTNAAEIERAQALGMRVIVTDHHQPGLLSCPADAVVNPLLNGYPFPRLCGTGVAYKLATALLGEAVAMQWLDLAALATVADIVPLLDENRVLVAHGLPRMLARPGLAALAQVAGLTPPLSTDALGYQLAPRLNAAGRIADANAGVRLLLTRDPAEAERLARELNAANAERKRVEAETTAEAALQAEAHDFVGCRVLFVRGAGWHTGVVGLVAGRLNHRFGVPVCALSEENGVLHGSLRGVRGVNLARCLQTCDDLLTRYGGHEMAAGVTLPAENDQAFRLRLEHAVRLSADPEAFVPVQEYDLPLAFSAVDGALLDQLSQLAPFGCGNPAPVFLTPHAQLMRRRAVGAQGAHLQVSLRHEDRLLDGIAFGMGALAGRLPDAVDAAYTLARETYQGRQTIQCHVEALRPSPAAQAAALACAPEESYHTALLRALLAEQAAVATPPAGNAAPDAELLMAAGCAPAQPMATAGAENPPPAVGGGFRASAAKSARLANGEIPAPQACLTAAPGDAPPPDPPSTPAPASPSDPWPAGVEAHLAGRQGTLFIAYTRDTAARFLARYGEQVDLAEGAPRDPRCFHTLLIKPAPGTLGGRFRTAVLLDGALTQGGAAYWQQCLPEAEAVLLPRSQALAQAAAAIDAGDAAYRALYRALRAGAYGSLPQTAAAAGLSPAQTLAGLTAFAQLGLLQFTEAPFQYALCEPNRCSLAQSPVLGALRALYA